MQNKKINFFKIRGVALKLLTGRPVTSYTIFTAGQNNESKTRKY